MRPNIPVLRAPEVRLAQATWTTACTLVTLKRELARSLTPDAPATLGRRTLSTSSSSHGE